MNLVGLDHSPVNSNPCVSAVHVRRRNLNRNIDGQLLFQTGQSGLQNAHRSLKSATYNCQDADGGPWWHFFSGIFHNRFVPKVHQLPYLSPIVGRLPKLGLGRAARSRVEQTPGVRESCTHHVATSVPESKFPNSSTDSKRQTCLREELTLQKR